MVLRRKIVPWPIKLRRFIFSPLDFHIKPEPLLIKASGDEHMGWELWVEVPFRILPNVVCHKVDFMEEAFWILRVSSARVLRKCISCGSECCFRKSLGSSPYYKILHPIYIILGSSFCKCESEIHSYPVSRGGFGWQAGVTRRSYS